jgi:lysyl-tRNA synthetase class I
MGFEFKTDQPAQKLVDSVTTLSVNEPLGRIPKSRVKNTSVEENLAQPIFTEIEEMKLAIQFIEENELYTKFLLWCGIQEQLKKAEDNLDS